MNEFVEPWQAVAGQQAARLEGELRRELPAGHVLSDRALRAVGRRIDCDDVLFEVVGLGLAVVHLTWARETAALWPRTELFTSWTDFVGQRMTPDHADYSA